MIKYSEEVYIQKHLELKCGKERLEALEKILRILGNFEKNKPIIIEDNEKGENYSEDTFKVTDNDNTIFTFIRFGLGYKLDDERYRKNFYLTMQRKDSNFIYKYDFSNLDQRLDFLDAFEVIEISYRLSESRILKLERGKYEFSALEIEENDKKYRLCFGRRYNKEDDNCEIELLEDLENIIERAKMLDVIDLENVLEIIKDTKKISFITIYKEKKELASISFNDGKITRYKISELNRNIEATLYSKIIRNTERVVDGLTVKTETEIEDEKHERIQEDYKLLFKKL